MKKIFIIFLTFLLMVTCLALPAAAAMPEQFGDYDNLLSGSSFSTVRFYSSPLSYQDNSMLSVYLKADTNYTFISSKGTRCFYVGQSFLDSSDYRSTFNYDSKNLFIFADASYVEDGLTVDIKDGVFTFNGTISAYAFIHLKYVTLYPGEYYLMGFTNDNSNNYNLFMYNNQDSSWYSYGSPTGKSYSSTRLNEFIIRLSPGTYTDYKVYPMLVNSSDYGEFSFGFSDSLYMDNTLSVINFKTPSNLSGSSVDGKFLFSIGINDVLLGNLNKPFSSAVDSSNDFYLIEGILTSDQISDIISGNQYQGGYNSGYDQGYKEGEFDGLNSTKFMNSTLLTAISAPFVIVSSALNFEIFGINFYHILQVLFTLLLVAFVVTKLKGRE